MDALFRSAIENQDRSLIALDRVFLAIDRIETIEDVSNIRSALYDLEQSSSDFRLNRFFDDLRAFESEMIACAAASDEQICKVARRLICDCFPYIVAWHAECRGNNEGVIPGLAEQPL